MSRNVRSRATMLPPPNEQADPEVHVPKLPPWRRSPLSSELERRLALQLGVRSRRSDSEAEAQTWLRVMADAAPWLDFEYLCWAVESTVAQPLRAELAVVAARWVHVHDPRDDQRRQLGLLLRTGSGLSSAGIAPLVCTLSVDFHPRAWLDLARSCKEPVFLRFGTMHMEVLRRPTLALSSVREARDINLHTRTLKHWVSVVERWREWARPCCCLDCERGLAGRSGSRDRDGRGRCSPVGEPSREESTSS